MHEKYTLQDWKSGQLLRPASQDEIAEGLKHSIFLIDDITTYSDVFLVDGKEVSLYIEKLPDVEDADFVVEYHYKDGDVGAYPLNLIEQENILEHFKEVLVKGEIHDSEYAGLEKIVLRLVDKDGN